MKRHLLYFGMLLAWPLAGLAQAPGRALPNPVASFFKEDFTPSTADDSTAYCAETTYRDSVTGVTRVYYPSGQLKQYVPYSNVRQRILFGTLTTWYENGTMRTKEDYVAGKRHGDLLTYYPNGTLKRRDHYVDGRSGVGACYAPNGAAIPYFAYEQLPLYPGGDAGLMDELARSLRLSLTLKETDALRAESYRNLRMEPRSWKREVFVQLAVAEDGRITDAQVVHSTASFLNRGALLSVAKLKRRFMPARRDGEVVASHFVVPISYNLDRVEVTRPTQGIRPIPFPRPGR